MTGKNRAPRPSAGKEGESAAFAAFMEKVVRKHPHLRARDDTEADNRYVARQSERKSKKS